MPLWSTKGGAYTNKREMGVAIHHHIVLGTITGFTECPEMHFSFDGSQTLQWDELPLVFLDLAEHNSVFITTKTDCILNVNEGQLIHGDHSFILSIQVSESTLVM